MNARDPRFIEQLRKRVRGTVKENEPLARYSTWRIGGPATILLPADQPDVTAALALAQSAGVPWFALGLGSNILLPDEGLEALVIRLGKGLDGIRSQESRWWIGAGMPAPLAARRTAQGGWAGVHKMVGVPGTVGGGVYMNAGCHGAEWSDVVRRVTLADSQGTISVREAAGVPFTYRRSGLDGFVVLEVEVELRPESAERLTEEVEELFRWRQEGTPFNQPCCGSTFKNPGGVSGVVEGGPRTAGQFIDAAGLKGFAIGGVHVSPKHANYFVNVGGGTAADVRALIRHTQAVVKDRCGAELETEVKIVGPDGKYLLND
ncbi:MAG: UDP-N-acetylmuramate dehydrogenase [Gemmatimonadota bacterium]